MILATRRGDVSLRAESLGQLLDRRTPQVAGVAVTQKAVSGLPAWMNAVRIASLSVASLKFRVWRGEGVERQRVSTTWQARLFSGVPNERESWFQVFEQTEASLTNSNNAYWLKLKDEALRVASVYVVAPGDVQTKWDKKLNRPLCRIRLLSGGWSEWVDSSVVLHFRAGFPAPGALVAPSPIELHRESLGGAIAKTRYETNFYEEGVHKSLAVTFPQGMKAEEARRWRDVYQEEHGGLEKSHRVRVFGGGAQVEAIGLSLQDSQYIDSMRLSIEDIARMTGVQASLMGVSYTDRPISPEHEQDRWLRYGLGPRLERIEQSVKADPDFFGSGARDYPLFDTSGVLRGDLATEADISLKKVQSGQWTPDEARAKDGLPPLPDGLGKIPQVVPVGGTPNPNPSPAPFDDDDDDDDERTTIHLHMPKPQPVNVSVPEREVHVHVPESRPPDVQVTVPETPVSVAVHVPEAPAPVVNNEVNVPKAPAPIVQNDITVETPRREVRFKRDGKGRLTGADVE